MNRYVLSVRSLATPEGLAASFFKLKAADKSVRRLPWLQGVRFAETPPEPIELYVETDDEYARAFADYVPTGIPLVSLRLKNVLIDAGVANIDYFPTAVLDAESMLELPEYWAINVIGSIPVADPAQSQGIRAFGVEGATLFDKFAERPELAAAPGVFRATESASTLVVDAHIMAACEAAGIDTLRFATLEAWFA